MPVSAVDRLPTADKAKYETYLQRFATNRNHYQADARQNLENATQYVKEKFESAGLTVSLQNFSTSITTTGQVCNIMLSHKILKLNAMYLLTEWEGRTGKYLARSQDVRTERSEVRAF